jgi:hypothetical protein
MENDFGGKMTEAAKERAAVVAWLRNLHWTHHNKRAADLFADVFERGDHLKGDTAHLLSSDTNAERLHTSIRQLDGDHLKGTGDE